MNTQSMNGQIVMTDIGHRRITINDKTYEIPDWVLKKGGNSVSQVNNEITINGYRFDPETNTFKKPSIGATIAVTAVAVIACIIGIIGALLGFKEFLEASGFMGFLKSL